MESADVAPAVVQIAESRVAASGELGADDVGVWAGARMYVARDIIQPDAGERASIGIEAAWAKAASETSLEGGEPMVLGKSERARALAFIAIRTPTAPAEASLAFGFGIAGERREAEYADGTVKWLAFVPSFAGAAWASGRVWVTRLVAIELEFGAVVTGEPRNTYDTTHHRAVISPAGRAGLAFRF